MLKKNRPAGVVVSIWSVRDRKPTPSVWSCLWLSDLYGGVSSELNGGVDWEIPLTPARSAEGRGQPAIYR